MPTFEIIIKNEKEALRMKLPEDIVERIKVVSSLNDEDFNELDNKTILRIIVKSLDSILYGFEHTKIHSITKTDVEGGAVVTEKHKNETTKK